MNEGLSTEDVKKRIKEEKKYTKLSSLLPKDVSLFGEAQAAQAEAKKDKEEIEEPVKFKEVKKVGLGDNQENERVVADTSALTSVVAIIKEKLK